MNSFLLRKQRNIKVAIPNPPYCFYHYYLSIRSKGERIRNEIRLGKIRSKTMADSLDSRRTCNEPWTEVSKKFSYTLFFPLWLWRPKLLRTSAPFNPLIYPFSLWLKKINDTPQKEEIQAPVKEIGRKGKHRDSISWKFPCIKQGLQIT